MAEDRGGELAVLGEMIEACRVQAITLDLPGAGHILARAATCLSLRPAEGSVPHHIAGSAVPPLIVRRPLRS